MAAVPAKLPAQFLENNTYDFSQVPAAFNNSWNNYCAPTVAGNLVYHFGNVVPALVQGNPYGPGNQPAADTGVTNIIGGVFAVNPADPPLGPGPPPGSLAQLMGTTRAGGTTLLGVNAGVTQYLAANGGGFPWQTQQITAANVGGGPPFLAMLQNDLANGYDVILVVAWLNGQGPGGPYQVPNGYTGGTSDGSPIGHAFEMIGFDNPLAIRVNDPANNGGVHNWAAEGTLYNVFFPNPPTDFRFMVGGAVAVAYGGVVTRPMLPLQLLGAVSRKTHPGAGDFDITLPSAMPYGVECRSGGANGDYTFVMTFTNTVIGGNAAVTAGTGNVSGVPVFRNNTMTVNLTGVTNAQTVTVTLSNVTDVFGQMLPNTLVSADILRSDTNANRSVNASDVSQTKARIGQAVEATNFRSDVNVSSTLTAADVSQVKSDLGTALP